jgi:hypothetical protein
MEKTFVQLSFTWTRWEHTALPEHLADLQDWEMMGKVRGGMDKKGKRDFRREEKSRQ